MCAPPPRAHFLPARIASCARAAGKRKCQRRCCSLGLFFLFLFPPPFLSSLPPTPISLLPFSRFAPKFGREEFAAGIKAAWKYAGRGAGGTASTALRGGGGRGRLGMDVCWQPEVTQQAAACFPSTKPLLIIIDLYIQLIIFFIPLGSRPLLACGAWPGLRLKAEGGSQVHPCTPKIWEQCSADSSDAILSLTRLVLQSKRERCLMFWDQGKGRAPAGIIVAGNFRKSSESYFTMTLSTSD